MTVYNKMDNEIIKDLRWRYIQTESLTDVRKALEILGCSKEEISEKIAQWESERIGNQHD